ncbi:hypothetical protein ACFWB3_07415 [[Kitasatospora] papulosa]|uniref:hypothetical protein n=1 Tax=[Kitasatospora] papulosa TaxID=1464011 RepID=UPI0036ABC7E6
MNEGGFVTDLSGGEHEGQWLALAIGGGVDLCGQFAVGPGDGVVCRFGWWGPADIAWRVITRIGQGAV